MKGVRRPSPALVIACAALFVALGGTSYAVIKLPAGSVGTKQLKRNAVTSPKVKNNAITGADVNEARLGLVPSANNAQTLDGLDSSAFARHEGLVLVSAPWANWTAADGTGTTVLPNLMQLNRPSAATDVQAVLTPEIPVALHGKRLRVLGAEFCYDGEDGVLDMVDLRVYTHGAGTAGNGALANQVTDGTDQTDASCRVYTFTTPSVLTEEQSLSLVLTLDFPSGGAFEIGRTTFILDTTATNAIAPS